MDFDDRTNLSCDLHTYVRKLLVPTGGDKLLLFFPNTKTNSTLSCCCCHACFPMTYINMLFKAVKISLVSERSNSVCVYVAFASNCQIRLDWAV